MVDAGSEDEAPDWLIDVDHRCGNQWLQFTSSHETVALAPVCQRRGDSNFLYRESRCRRLSITMATNATVAAVDLHATASFTGAHVCIRLIHLLLLKQEAIAHAARACACARARAHAGCKRS